MDNNQTNQEVTQAKTPNPASVIDLIRVEKLSEQATILAIIAYEQEEAIKGKFPLMFSPLINKAFRFAEASAEIQQNCLILTNISQFSKIGLSIFVKVANQEVIDFTAFRQASYSEPFHSYVDMDRFPNEKEAIEGLLKSYVEASGEPLENVFLSVYYVTEDTLMRVNEGIANENERTHIVNVSALVKPEPAAEEAQSDQQELLSVPPSGALGVENI